MPDSFLKKPIFKTSESGVRRALLIKKAPAQADGEVLEVPQIHFRRALNWGAFYVKGREEGQGKRWVSITGS